jgi:hypothetical protein
MNASISTEGPWDGSALTRAFRSLMTQVGWIQSGPYGAVKS